MSKKRKLTKQQQKGRQRLQEKTLIERLNAEIKEGKLTSDRDRV